MVNGTVVKGGGNSNRSIHTDNGKQKNMSPTDDEVTEIINSGQDTGLDANNETNNSLNVYKHSLYIMAGAIPKYSLTL